MVHGDLRFRETNCNHLKIDSCYKVTLNGNCMHSYKCFKFQLSTWQQTIWNATRYSSIYHIQVLLVWITYLLYTHIHSLCKAVQDLKMMSLNTV